MLNYVNKNIKKLEPYKVPELDYEIKLDANENPYPVPESLPENLKEEIGKIIFNSMWNYYPDPEAKNLRNIIAKENKLEKENILIGNGSDEIILNLMLTFISEGKSILVHTPTFSMYKILAQIANGNTIEVALDKNFELDKEKMLENVIKDDVAMTFITYPNNPTGNLFDKNLIKEIIEKAKGLVVIDEAYYEFAKDSFVDKIKKYKNLIILRTFSKAYGMAGLRVGYMFANKEICNEVNKVRLPYNLNKISQLIAEKLYENKIYFEKIIDEILENKKELKKDLEKIDGLKLFKSDTNSIFFYSEKSEEIFSSLLEEKILIRKFKGDMKNYLRITIGKKEDNKKIVKIIEKLLK